MTTSKWLLPVAVLLGGLLAGCGGDDGPVASNVVLPLSVDERCAPSSSAKAGCVMNPAVPVGATLAGEGIVVRYRGSSFQETSTNDALNTSGSLAAVYLDITNNGDAPLEIDHYSYDFRIDGVFETPGSSMGNCGRTPNAGQIPPGETMTLRWCGFVATVGQMRINDVVFDLHAPCRSCDAYLALQPSLIDASAHTDVIATVDALVSAGAGTAAELGIDALDFRGTGTGPDGEPVEPEPGITLTTNRF